MVGNWVAFPRPLVTARYVSIDSHLGVGESVLPVHMVGVDAWPPLLHSPATTLLTPSITTRLFFQLLPKVAASSYGWSDWLGPLMTNPGCGRQNSVGVP